MSSSASPRRRWCNASLRAAIACHTWAMSATMSDETLPRIALPMQNSGSSMSMPTRIVQVSATHPISGRISRPGMIHSEAMEKPVARARAGIASDNVARMPGAIIASIAETAQFSATATPMLGASANPADSTAVARQTRARKRTSAATSVP